MTKDELDKIIKDSVNMNPIPRQINIYTSERNGQLLNEAIQNEIERIIEPVVTNEIIHLPFQRIQMIDTIFSINKEVAKELGFSEDLVKKVNKFYWEKGIKDTIRDGSITNIRIRGIGTISTSKHKLRGAIEDLITLIRITKDRTTDYKTKTKQQVLDEQMNQLTKLLIRRNELAIAYYQKECLYRERLKSGYYDKRNLE